MDLTGTMLRAAAARPRVLVVCMPGERPCGWPPSGTYGFGTGHRPQPRRRPICCSSPGPHAPTCTRRWNGFGRICPPRAPAHTSVPPTEYWPPLMPPVPDSPQPAAQREQEPPAETDSRQPQDLRREQSSDQDGTAGHAFLEEAAKDGERGEEPSPDRSNGRYTGSGSAHSSLKQHHGDHGGEEKRGDGGDAHEDHQGHGGHGGHGGMEMPGGLPMAGQGEDRDGLTLDRLHVPLGPLLSDWPTGLTLRLVLQGDVVQAADLDEEPLVASRPVESFWVQPWLRSAVGEAVGSGEAARRRAAARLDSLGRLLVVAGWPAEAMKARRLRDDLLDGAPAAALASRLERLGRMGGPVANLALADPRLGRADCSGRPSSRGERSSGPGRRGCGSPLPPVADRHPP